MCINDTSLLETLSLYYNPIDLEFVEKSKAKGINNTLREKLLPKSISYKEQFPIYMEKEQNKKIMRKNLVLKRSIFFRISKQKT